MKWPAALGILLLACASTRDAASAPKAEVDEEAPCATDEDCAFTRVAPGACCPMLCTPRVVTRKRAEELQAGIVACSGKPGSCPQPLCRPPQQDIAPACRSNRCVARVVSTN